MARIPVRGMKRVIAAVLRERARPNSRTLLEELTVLLEGAAHDVDWLAEFEMMQAKFESRT